MVLYKPRELKMVATCNKIKLLNLVFNTHTVQQILISVNLIHVRSKSRFSTHLNLPVTLICLLGLCG